MIINSSVRLTRYHHVLKGKFLEGKRNHRVDHLLYTLIKNLIPYYAFRLRRQCFDFEGPDLEVMERKKIVQDASTITSDAVVDVTGEPDIYLVKSFSSDHQHRVDLEASTCTCPSYPLIHFCKHIQAVQTHRQLPPPSQAFTIAVDILALPSTSSHIPISESAPTQMTQRPGTLMQKLERLCLLLRNSPEPGYSELGATRDLERSLDQLLSNIDTSTAMQHILPHAQKIAPNQHSWTETAEAMIGTRKSVKRKHTDPYAGGEQSGKKAKEDAKRKVGSISSTSYASQSLPGHMF